MGIGLKRDVVRNRKSEDLSACNGCILKRQKMGKEMRGLGLSVEAIAPFRCRLEWQTLLRDYCKPPAQSSPLTPI